MLLYIFVAIWPLIVGWLYYNKPLAFGNNCLSLNKHIFIALLPIFILLAFRSGDMGADTGTYVRHFERMIYTSLEQEFAVTRMEHGYIVFVKAITHLTHNGLVYQVICVSIIMLGLFVFLMDQEENAFYTLFFYCSLGLFIFTFTGVRQCIAMSLCLMSYHFVKDRKYITFAVFITIAFFFHKSSILFVVVPLIMNLKIGFMKTALYGLAALIAGKYLDHIQNWFNEQLEYNYEIEATGNGMIFLIVLILLTIYSFIEIFNSNKSLNKNRIEIQLMNINYIALFFWIMRLSTRIAERPSFYFLFFSCALYGHVLNKNTETANNRVFKIAIICFSLALYIYRLRTNFASFVPYQFY